MAYGVESMISEWLIRKNVEGSGGGLILKHYPGICLEGLRKTTKTSVRIAGLRAEFWTRDLPITKSINNSTTMLGSVYVVNVKLYLLLMISSDNNWFNGFCDNKSNTEISLTQPFLKKQNFKQINNLC
jgi:hypothetical protein